MKLADALAAWDGKMADWLKELYILTGGGSTMSAALLRIMERKDTEAAASWMLKQQLSSGHRLDPAQEDMLAGILTKLANIDDKLHVLQCMQYLRISKKHCDAYASFVSACLAEDNKFVRAWAYSGLYELAVRHPEYRKEAEESLTKATKDPAASVRARARAVLKKGFVKKRRARRP